MTLWLSLLLTFANITNRVLRSTSVAMKLLLDPAIKSPSQCPGTARSSTSAGRSRIETALLNFPKPLRFNVAWRDRLMDRVARKCACSSFFKTPRV
mmetsp:Transcript_32018/g.41215  ORF Transcript_32018/g.41215 Transcript_32018/m.41215 type:complete len:96 (-) Transcript_32018:806-1093(-)